MRVDECGLGECDIANVADSDTNAIAKKYQDKGWAVTPVA